MIDEKQEDHILHKPTEQQANNILLKKEAVSQSIEAYRRILYQGRSNVPIYEVKTRIHTLFDDIKEAMKKDLKENDFQELERYLRNNNSEEILKAWEIINKWLYEKGLTKIFKDKTIL